MYRVCMGLICNVHTPQTCFNWHPEPTYNMCVVSVPTKDLCEIQSHTILDSSIDVTHWLRLRFCATSRGQHFIHIFGLTNIFSLLACNSLKKIGIQTMLRVVKYLLACITQENRKRSYNNSTVDLYIFNWNIIKLLNNIKSIKGCHSQGRLTHLKTSLKDILAGISLHYHLKLSTFDLKHKYFSTLTLKNV